MEQAIKKAIEGGWDFRAHFSEHFGDIDPQYPLEKYRKAVLPMSGWLCEILLRPLFWQALCIGAKLTTPTTMRHTSGKFSGPRTEKVRVTTRETWVYYWHEFIDHLASGGTAEEFFMDLLSD
jgi:hypothetical protein